MKSKKLVSVLCATMSSLLLFGGNGSSLSAPRKFAVAILCAGGIFGGSKYLVDRAKARAKRGSKCLVNRAKARAKLGTCDTYTGETEDATCEQKNEGKPGTCDTYTGETKNAICGQKNEEKSNLYYDSCDDDDDDDNDYGELIYPIGELWEILEDKKKLFDLLSDLKSTQARCYDDYCPIDSPLVVDFNYLRSCSEEVRKNYEGPYRFKYRNGDFAIVSVELYIYGSYSAFSDTEGKFMTFSTHDIICMLNTWSGAGRNSIFID